MAPKAKAKTPDAPVSGVYRLTKAQHEKALTAAQQVPDGSAPGYATLANKLGAYQMGQDVDLDEKEIAMLRAWGVNLRDAD